MAAVLQELVDLKKALDKAMKQSETDVSTERLMDILKAIQVIKVTPSLIKDSKMGKTLQGVRTKFSSEPTSLPEVCNLARDIMVAWKQIVEDQMQKEKSAASSSTVTIAAAVAETAKPPPVSAAPTVSSSAAAPSASSKAAISSSSSSSSSSAISSSGSSSLLASFPDGRRKVIRLLSDQVKLSTADGAKADAVALAIDKAIDDLPQHSYDLDNKSYMGKLRSLIFNLKRNESLRTDILSGALTPALLVALSPADLATDELRRARQGLAAVDMESRRTDWLDENKTKIQASVGLDPTNVWEYDEDEESVELE